PPSRRGRSSRHTSHQAISLRSSGARESARGPERYHLRDRISPRGGRGQGDSGTHDRVSTSWLIRDRPAGAPPSWRSCCLLPVCVLLYPPQTDRLLIRFTSKPIP